jgi:hypothetical protein
VNVKNSIIAKMFEELNSPLKGKVEKQPTKELNQIHLAM